ncbi:hypothetical protein HHI36_008444 [Cryptolaemus montrouzieri]|uniref:Uncharacterized protein n=1 Tax=Cryptolaemus montrouzieri TaxID=559131 RepID=A0ABD2MTA8_9CUCU
MNRNQLTMVSDIVHFFENFENKDADGTMIPETDKRASDHNHSTTPHLDEEGLIIPRKPANPVKENQERQNLHRELNLHSSPADTNFCSYFKFALINSCPTHPTRLIPEGFKLYTLLPAMFNKLDILIIIRTVIKYL